MSATKANQGLKLAPFRPMQDFLLDTSKYIAPSFNDLKRLNNRVSSNLLYYQTNYFAISALVFALFVLFGFNKMIVGSFGITTTAFIILVALDKVPQLTPLRNQYPQAIYGLGPINLLVVYLCFRPILFFVLAILVPVAFWIIHASVRSRGIKNKINNKVEQIGGQVYTNSPMGIVLTYLGLDTKSLEE